jgi:succinoglycan biosynthesis transport protein ExoP
MCARRGSCVVVVVAAHPAEGCSTVAAQLALLAASSGTRTALIDADMRFRGLSDVLGVGVETSLANAILSESDPKSVLVPVPDTKMYFGPAPANGNCKPLDILASPAVENFFEALRDEFDLIVVDTPPMANYIDASTMVEHANCVLVVVKADQTEQSDVAEMLHRLATEAQPPIGIVLNMVRPGR